MKYITEALLFLALLCLTNQGVESRPSGAPEKTVSEERLKRDAQGAHLNGATFYDGKHNFGPQVNTYHTSQINNGNVDGTTKHATSTSQQHLDISISLQPQDIKDECIEKCVKHPVFSAKQRNGKFPFDYSGSTQKYVTEYNEGFHNFDHERNYQNQPTAVDNALQSHRVVTSPQIKTTEENIPSKVCHWEKVSNPEQGSIEKTPERQKRAPVDYRGSILSYGGSHVQAEAGANPSWDNHQSYQGSHIQNKYQRPNYGPSPHQPYRQPGPK